MDILILRDPKESRAKCSLSPLRGQDGIRFVDYHRARRLEAGERILLHVEGEVLSAADRGPGLLLLDCSWRRVDRLLRSVDGPIRARSLPPLTTAYPRRSKTFEDPGAGLASVEALFAASCILGSPRPELLEGYRWRERFLELNPALSG